MRAMMDQNPNQNPAKIKPKSKQNQIQIKSKSKPNPNRNRNQILGNPGRNPNTILGNPMKILENPRKLLERVENVEVLGAASLAPLGVGPWPQRLRGMASPMAERGVPTLGAGEAPSPPPRRGES